MDLAAERVYKEGLGWGGGYVDFGGIVGECVIPCEPNFEPPPPAPSVFGAPLLGAPHGGGRSRSPGREPRGSEVRREALSGRWVPGAGARDEPGVRLYPHPKPPPGKEGSEIKEALKPWTMFLPAWSRHVPGRIRD